MDKIEKISTGFTQVPNELLNSKEISLKAKALFAFMFSKPNGWNFTASSMAKQLLEGRNTILSTLNELSDNDYLSYIKGSDGYGTYTLYPSPKFKNQQKPKFKNPTVRKLNPISNTYLLSNKESKESIINNTKEKPKKVTWGTHKELWSEFVAEKVKEFFLDDKNTEWTEERYPNTNLLLTLKDKSEYWKSEEGFKNKMRTHRNNWEKINWTTTLRNAIGMGRVYNQKERR